METLTEAKNFILIKEKDGEQATLFIDSEEDLQKHLEAMWRYTEWKLIGVIRR